MFFCNSSDFLDRLNRSDFVVCRHNGNQNGLRCDGCFEFIQIDNAVLIDADIGDFRTALFFQILAGVKNRMMLDFCGDDVVSFIFICFKGSF